MKIIGLFNDEEVKEIKDDIKIIEKGNTKSIESGFFGVRIEEETSDSIFYDVYRIVGFVEVKKNNQKRGAKK